MPVVLANNDLVTRRVGDVFLKIDADQTRTDVEVEVEAMAMAMAMAMAISPTLAAT